jgi:excisionase family DNA binding protein
MARTAATAAPRETVSAKDQLITYQEAADRLGVVRETVKRLVYRGVLPVVHVGRAPRIPVAALDDFIANGGVPADKR